MNVSLTTDVSSSIELNMSFYERMGARRQDCPFAIYLRSLFTRESSSAGLNTLSQ